MRIPIDVTQKHIKEGHACNSRYCPVALAVVDALRKYKVNANVALVQVNKKQIFYDTKQLMLRMIDLPEIAAEFIHNFDNDIPVNPFSFEIEVRDE